MISVPSLYSQPLEIRDVADELSVLRRLVPFEQVDHEVVCFLSTAREGLDLLVDVLVELLDVRVNARHIVVEGREGSTYV